jgi:hypothetical protein
MKIDKGSLFFNMKVKGSVATAGWSSTLGKQSAPFPLDKPGATELLKGMKEKTVRIKFDLNNPKHISCLKSPLNYKIIEAAKFDKVFINAHKLDAYFILLTTKEIKANTKSHIGRNNLRFNPEIQWNEYSNKIFKEKATLYLGGGEPAWICYDISVKNIDELHFSVIKVSDRPILYESLKIRSNEWQKLITDVEGNTEENLIISEFREYLTEVHKVKTIKTANEYIGTLPAVKVWFIKNKLCDDGFQIWNPENDINLIQAALSNKLKDDWKKAARKGNKGDSGWMMASWNRWVEFIEWRRNGSEPGKEITNFDIAFFQTSVVNSGLHFSDKLIIRFIASLCTKPFVICSGLSGSGKTKLAQSFVHWISESDKQYKIIPVGADWTNREPLLGYPNGLDPKSYVTPDSGALQLMLEASRVENQSKPYFMILDEMNLSHVERYFADFLSIMESQEKLKLYSGENRYSKYKNDEDPNEAFFIPKEIEWPQNLFIIGTVNIDETTYMFSPKVLDRANVIEFRITNDEITSFLGNPGVPDLTKLTKQGVAMSKSFMSIATDKKIEVNKDLATESISFFNQLQNVGAEFGYRSATEIMLLASKLKTLEPKITDNECLDVAIMQKLLPKLHGSRSKLVKVLIALAGLCINSLKKEDFEKTFEDLYKKDFQDIKVKYPISFEKLIRMYKNLIDNGFTSYAEA